MRKRNKELWTRALAQVDCAHCLKCGYDACVSALDYHHKNPKTKTFQPSAFIQSTRPTEARVARLLEETICLCGRCHRELHAGMWKLDTLPPLPIRGKISFEDPWKPLFTPRQSRIFGLLSEGKTRAEIAQRLGITRETLRSMVRNMRVRAKGKYHI